MDISIQLDRSLEYAERNFLDNSARHLQVDKAFLAQHFDLNGKLVLDFGCGMGGMSLWYASNWHCKVHGVDIDGHHIQVAEVLRDRHDLRNVEFEKRDILETPLADTYDCAMLNDVAEHIPYPILEGILRQIGQHLRPGGRIFISYPPWQGPYASHVTRVTGLPWSQYIPDFILIPWLRRRPFQLTGEHESNLIEAYRGLNHLTHSRLMRVAEKAGLRLAVRQSHSLAARFLPQFLVRLFPFNFLISKEIVLLEKA